MSDLRRVTQLDEDERLVLQLAADGFTREDASAMMGITAPQRSEVLARIYRKFGTHSFNRALSLGIHWGLVTVREDLTVREVAHV